MKKSLAFWLGLLGLLAQGPVLYLSVMESEGLEVASDVAARGMAGSALGLALVALGGTALTGEYLVRVPRPPKSLYVSFGLTLTLVCTLIGFHRAARLVDAPVVEILDPGWIAHNIHILAYGHILPLLFELALFSCVVVAAGSSRQENDASTRDELKVQLALARAQVEGFDTLKDERRRLDEENARLRTKVTHLEESLAKVQKAAARVPEILDPSILNILQGSEPLTVSELGLLLEVPGDNVRQALRRLRDQVESVPYDGPGKSKRAFRLRA